MAHGGAHTSSTRPSSFYPKEGDDWHGQMDWVMQNTVFLHFCGKRKPWSRQSANRFSALYKHYMRLASR